MNDAMAVSANGHQIGLRIYCFLSAKFRDRHHVVDMDKPFSIVPVKGLKVETTSTAS